jgi:hypothetical protein
MDPIGVQKSDSPKGERARVYTRLKMKATQLTTDD